jgi:hypothetical protein
LGTVNWYNWLSLGNRLQILHQRPLQMVKCILANPSGCGFIFAIQDNGDHYVVSLIAPRSSFLMRSSCRILQSCRLIKGTGRVNFSNPADEPVEADFTLIVKDTQAFVLVDGKLLGTYLLSTFRDLDGEIGLSVLSGTNKDYGTRCEMTNIHVWIPNK